MQKSFKNPHKLGSEKEFNAIVEQDSDGYFVGSILELPGCHTQAKTMKSLNKRLKEAIEVYLEVEKESPEPS